jgi:hypothetical protein
LAEAVLLFMITPAAMEASTYCVASALVSPWIMLLIVGVRDRRAHRLQRSSSAPGVASPVMRPGDYPEK